ncbi:MAG: hypothetical protein ACK466_19065, partial [Pseudanabaena sp.]
IKITIEIKENIIARKEFFANSTPLEGPTVSELSKFMLVFASQEQFHKINVLIHYAHPNSMANRYKKVYG